MAFDYAELLATAKELVREFGKQITLLKFDLTPADTDQPWRGSATPRGTLASTATVFGVPIPPSSAEELGIDTDDTRQDDGYQRRVDQVLIVEPGDDPGDLDAYNVAVIDGEEFGVVRASKLRPGDTTLLYFFWVRR